jgi:2-oxoglutarate ferredoxin oxidoreductase subunit alpha
MKPGTQRLTGSQACAEGALSAGCRFLGYYPIVPCLELIERFAKGCRHAGATLIQMEDEIAALAAVLGASWAGKKSMTVTSGPGFSLMMEHVGLGVMLETPCVIVDIQRGSPSEGVPNAPGQGDMMQARWGSHGDYEVIALAPDSPQEMFDLTVRAFNLSERYRTPVMVMSDQHVAQMTEKVVMPRDGEIALETRKYYAGPKGEYLPFDWGKDHIAPMADIGGGYRFHVTGLTHDRRGYPALDAASQELNVHTLIRKIRLNAEDIIETDEDGIEDADVVVVSYGATSKPVRQAVKRAREGGIKAGVLRLVTVWPFPERRIGELAKKVKAFVVPEMNHGQMVFEVQRCAQGDANTVFVSRVSAESRDSSDILYAIRLGATAARKPGEIIEADGSR